MATKQKNKNKKIGRSKRNGQAARYVAERRHARSHFDRIVKHLNRYGCRDKKAILEAKRYKIEGYISQTVRLEDGNHTIEI